MTQPHKNYHDYLLKRSILGKLYRNYFLYPRLARFLSGICIDVGCGIGDFLDWYSDSIGVDINLHNISFCTKRGLNAVHLDSPAFPFADNTFDCAVLDNVIEHILNPVDILLETTRVCKNNSVVIIGVPGCKGFKRDPDHKIFYNPQTLNELMQSIGFYHADNFETPFSMFGLSSKYLAIHCFYGIYTVKKNLFSP
jgi:SAM-dependent methyltransferase